jgi:hypothetical protein
MGRANSVEEQTMLRKLLPAGVIVALLTAPVFAQLAPPSSDSTIGVPLNPQIPPTQEQIEKRKAADRDYNAAIQKIPDKKPSTDPWGNIRSSSPSAKNKQQ